MKSRNIEREIGEMRCFDPMDYYSCGKNIKSDSVLWRITVRSPDQNLNRHNGTV